MADGGEQGVHAGHPFDLAAAQELLDLEAAQLERVLGAGAVGGGRERRRGLVEPTGEDQRLAHARQHAAPLVGAGPGVGQRQRVEVGGAVEGERLLGGHRRLHRVAAGARRLAGLEPVGHERLVIARPVGLERTGERPVHAAPRRRVETTDDDLADPIVVRLELL
jgi:hypothetical protein